MKLTKDEQRLAYVALSVYRWTDATNAERARKLLAKLKGAK